MAKFTYIKKNGWNGYEIRIIIKCTYNKNQFINEFDSHDMTLKIEETFEQLAKKEIKDRFIETAKFLIDRVPQLHAVEFIGKDSISKYYAEEIKELF